MEAWIVAAILAAGAVYLWNRWRQLARIEFIRNYTFPHGLFAKLNAKRPQLDTKQMQLVARALRQFFLAYLRGGRRYVSMPSQVTDDLWHEFILYTSVWSTAAATSSIRPSTAQRTVSATRRSATPPQTPAPGVGAIPVVAAAAAAVTERLNQLSG
jgi:hypothetical protein